MQSGPAFPSSPPGEPPCILLQRRRGSAAKKWYVRYRPFRYDRHNVVSDVVTYSAARFIQQPDRTSAPA